MAKIEFFITDRRNSPLSEIYNCLFYFFRRVSQMFAYFECISYCRHFFVNSVCIITNAVDLSVFESCWKNAVVEKKQKSCQEDLLTKSRQLALDFVHEGSTSKDFDMLQHSTFNRFCL